MFKIKLYMTQQSLKVFHQIKWQLLVIHEKDILYLYITTNNKSHWNIKHPDW